MSVPVPEHEKLFDQISGKLTELSQKTESQNNQDRWSERLEQMQQNLRVSQEELKATQTELQERIRAMDNMNFTTNDMDHEIRRLSEQLEQERMNNSKLSTDLAKSLELNLKLQFEIEEIRTKANTIVLEERKLNQFLTDKNRVLANELDLAQALQNETRLELSKAKDRFYQDQDNWNKERANLETKARELELTLEKNNHQMQDKNGELQVHAAEIARLNETLQQFETHAVQQNDVMRSLSTVAERKMVELKLALDKKVLESHDYYSHLQQALTQIQVLRQENSALKDYIAKLTALHQVRNNEVRV